MVTLELPIQGEIVVMSSDTPVARPVPTSELKPLDGTTRPASRKATGPPDFRVGSRTDAQSLAGAIAAALLQRGGQLHLHAIGQSAVYRAMKATAIARGHVAASAYNLVITLAGFEDVTPEDQTDLDGEDVITGMIFVLNLTR